MARDNYRDRIEDYQRYQDYRYDQQVFHRGLSERTTEVYQALGRRDHERAAWALRIPAAHMNRTSTRAVPDQPVVQTLASQTYALIRDIRESAYISSPLQSNWASGLEALPLIDCERAHERIVDFKAAFLSWKLKHRPGEDIWSIGDTKRWLFDSQVLLIECKIDRIRWILEAEIANIRPAACR